MTCYLHRSFVIFLSKSLVNSSLNLTQVFTLHTFWDISPLSLTASFSVIKMGKSSFNTICSWVIGWWSSSDRISPENPYDKSVLRTFSGYAIPAIRWISFDNDQSATKTNFPVLIFLRPMISCFTLQHGMFSKREAILLSKFP